MVLTIELAIQIIVAIAVVAGAVWGASVWVQRQKDAIRKDQREETAEIVASVKNLGQKLDKASADLDQKMEQKVGELQLRAAKQEADIVIAKEELSQYKVHVAETFATKDSVSIGLTRLESTVERVGDGLTSRIDRILEMQIQRDSSEQRPSRQS